MPTYFFDFRVNDMLATDEEGTELDDAEAARREAVAALVEGLRDSADGPWLEHEFATRCSSLALIST